MLVVKHTQNFISSIVGTNQRGREALSDVPKRLVANQELLYRYTGCPKKPQKLLKSPIVNI